MHLLSQHFHTKLIRIVFNLEHIIISLSLDNLMEKLIVEPIPSRNWKVSKERWELVYGERERERKKSKHKVDERIYYMWFNYLQLCLDLESINHSVPKRGGRGKIISTTKVKVSKSIYKDWDLEKVKKPVLENSIKKRNIDYFSMRVGLNTPEGHNIIL